jgi:hypothetical protein
MRMAAAMVAPAMANNGQDDAFRGVASSGDSLTNRLVFEVEVRLVMDRVSVLVGVPYANGYAVG